MPYCDSNLFIYPALYRGAKAVAAAKILKAVAEGTLECSTSSLTVNEVLWIVWKKASKEKAIEQAELVLEFPNLEILDTKASDLRRAVGLIKTYPIKPRDAIHAACSLNHGIFTIVSDDEDFDAVKELDRLSFEGAVKRLLK